MHAFPLSEANLIIFGAHLVKKRDRSTMSPNMSSFLNVISKRDSRVPALCSSWKGQGLGFLLCSFWNYMYGPVVHLIFTSFIYGKLMSYSLYSDWWNNQAPVHRFYLKSLKFSRVFLAFSFPCLIVNKVKSSGDVFRILDSEASCLCTTQRHCSRQGAGTAAHCS